VTVFGDHLGWRIGVAKERFGPFGVAFQPRGDSTAYYLRLLNLGEGSADAAAAIQRAAERRGAERAFVRLLNDPNWRPHLVAVVAAHHVRYPSAVSQCWRAFDRGSWVSPQIAAVLSLIDEEFPQHATERLVADCPLILDPNDESDRHRIEHRATHPNSLDPQSAKNAAALHALMATDHPDHIPVGTYGELIERDRDNSGQRALDWRASLLSTGAD
jgi:hypothetical protein